MKWFHSWLFLVQLTFRRQWWSLQALIAIGLLGLLALFVRLDVEFGDGLEFEEFSKAVVSAVYISFILPILCLSFGTNAFGGDWEEKSLVWLLTRPLPRPLIYLAKFTAMIPWTFGLTLGGLWLLGFLAGPAGMEAVRRYWPAVAWGTFAYLALFVLIGAWFRHSTIIGVSYSFVLETIVGNMPGLVKRASIGFYSRCMTIEAGYPDVQLRPGELFMPVDSETAILVLGAISVVLLIVGMIMFSRKEYIEMT